MADGAFRMTSGERAEMLPEGLMEAAGTHPACLADRVLSDTRIPRVSCRDIPWYQNTWAMELCQARLSHRVDPAMKPRP
jgi:hypothetical protein